jgi:hypothetical protein
MPVRKIAVAALSTFTLLSLPDVASAQMADLTKY